MRYLSSINGYVLDNTSYKCNNNRGNYKNYSTNNTIKSKRSFKSYIGYIVMLSLISIVMFLGVFTIFEGKADTATLKPEILKEVVVKQGDSIWSIAKNTYDDDVDIRKACYKIKEFNGLTDNMLIAGQVLIIPSLN